jgi:hypothetical protein
MRWHAPQIALVRTALRRCIPDTGEKSLRTVRLHDVMKRAGLSGPLGIFRSREFCRPAEKYPPFF